MRVIIWSEQSLDKEDIKYHIAKKAAERGICDCGEVDAICIKTSVPYIS